MSGKKVLGLTVSIGGRPGDIDGWFVDYPRIRAHGATHAEVISKLETAWNELRSDVVPEPVSSAFTMSIYPACQTCRHATPGPRVRPVHKVAVTGDPEGKLDVIDRRKVAGIGALLLTGANIVAVRDVGSLDEFDTVLCGQDACINASLRLAVLDNVMGASKLPSPPNYEPAVELERSNGKG